MHQIVCRPGLRPRPHFGSLQLSPDPLGGFKGPISKVERGADVKNVPEIFQKTSKTLKTGQKNNKKGEEKRFYTYGEGMGGRGEEVGS